MALNPAAVGLRAAPVRFSWGSKDAILYALGVGCGVEHLAFTTENTRGVEQRMLPTYATIIGARALQPDGVGDYDHAKMVHGSQAIEVLRELPVQGEVEIQAEVSGVWDKGSAGVLDVDVAVRDVATGSVFLKTRHGLFCRDAGGFGGERGPSPKVAFPDRAPDHVAVYPTTPDQALVYRLSGDRNPLHSDPDYARRGGFERPILHGLCSYGITGRGLLEHLCAGDPARFRSMSARFSQPVYPGDVLTVQMWRDGPEKALFRTLNGQGGVVIDQGEARLNAT